MFRNRNFLFGLGAGLIFGALLLQLMNASDMQKSKLNTIDQINGEEKLYTQSDVDKLVEESNQSNKGKAEPDATEQTKVNGSAADAKVPEDKQEAVKMADDGSVEVTKQVIRIKPGANLTNTADLLKSKGLIKDEKAFIALMKNASDKIQVGFFFFDGKLTAEQVKSIITSPPFSK